MARRLGISRPTFVIGFTAVALLSIGASAAYMAGTGSAQQVPSKAYSTKPIEVAQHKMQEGQMVVMEIPVSSVKGMTERQTCFVWRDTEYKSATMQCPNDRSSFNVDPPN